MEDHDFEKMTPFDQLISTQSLQILKRFPVFSFGSPALP